jgi:hypothetical protein
VCQPRLIRAYSGLAKVALMPSSRSCTAQLVASLAELEEALASGWRVDPPVYHKQLAGHPATDWYYDLILWCDGRVRIMTLVDDETSRACFARHRWMVTHQ